LSTLRSALRRSQHLIDGPQHVTGAAGQFLHGGRGVVRRLDHRVQQLAGQLFQRRGRRDQAGLTLDPVGVPVIFRARHAPAAPVRRIGDDHRIGPREGVMGTVLGLLPLVPRAQQAPVLAAVRGRVLDRHQQLVGQELAAQTHVVGHPDRLVEALGPDGLDLLDLGPGADALDPDLLTLLELRARHRRLRSSTDEDDARG
jgi:hypothetical protein